VPWPHITAPGQQGAVFDLLWGCKSQVFPALLLPPGCA
jgi:hypothetical protein